MSSRLGPIVDAVRRRILLVPLAGWVNRHQLEVIEYLREENRVLKELSSANITSAPASRRVIRKRDIRAGQQASGGT